MLVEVKRFADNGQTTISGLYINGIFQCFGIEDTERYIKVKHETRIPNGTYQLVLRDQGGFHNRYLKKFPEIHKGMICVVNSDDYKIVTDKMSFQYILFHIGNSHKNSSGCYLLNDSVNGYNFIGGNSTSAYKRVYPVIANHLEKCGYAKIIYSQL